MLSMSHETQGGVLLVWIVNSLIDPAWEVVPD